jgi:hypothetical protein
MNDIRDDSIITFVGPKYFKASQDDNLIMIASCFDDNSQDEGRKEAMLSVSLADDVRRYELEGVTPKLYDLGMGSEHVSRILCSFIKQGYHLFGNNTRVIVRFVKKNGLEFAAVDAPEDFIDGLSEPILETYQLFNKK